MEAVDCAYRSLALVPRGQDPPPGFEPHSVVRVPAKRVVVASGHYDAGIMLTVGALEAIAATDEPADTWKLPEIKERIESGDIAFIGYWDALDYETIRGLEPDLVLTSSAEVGNVLISLGFPTMVTYNGLDNGLENRLRLFPFLGALVGAEEEAAKVEAEIREALAVCQKAAEGLPRPKLGWGVFFNNRVYALDGDFWLAEIMEVCGGDYVMSSLRSGMLELSLEDFLARSTPAEIYFASLLHEGPVETKADYLNHHPALSRVRAFSGSGAVYSPEDVIFQDTGRLKYVIEELAAIIHPDLHPAPPPHYFRRLN
jgi:iron complex transport system substrate-binding protein